MTSFAVLVSTSAANAQRGPWRFEHPSGLGTTVRGACRAGDSLWVAGEVATFGRLSSNLRELDAVAVESTVDFAHVACCPSGVFAVGAAGTVVRHHDGATHERSLGDALLTTVACVGERGVAVASARGEIFVSSDGGDSYERRTTPHPVYALIEHAGAIVGGGPMGTVSRTTDLGRTWTTSRTGLRGNVQAFATQRSDLVAVGTQGIALRSSDAGVTWTSLPTGVSSDLLALAADPSGELLAVGAGPNVVGLRAGASQWSTKGRLEQRSHALVATRGGLVALGVGGRSASRRGSGAFVPTPRWETSIFAGWADARVRVVVGDRGFIARAVGRSELRPVRSPVITALHRVVGNARGVMLAVGGEGTILRSTDRGARWTRVAVETDSTFLSVWLDDEGHALAIGQRGLRMRSDDGGRTWEDMSGARDEQRSDVLVHDGAWIVVGTQGRIERSVDFGRTWTVEPGPFEGADLRTPVVTADGALLATVRPGVVVRRDTRGRWTRTELHPSAFFSGLVRHGDTWVLAASDGETFVSSDEGRTWRKERRVTREVITGLFAGPGGLWATGYWGMVMERR